VAATSTLGVPLTLGAGGATLTPAVGKTVTFSGAVNGDGSITKSGTQRRRAERREHWHGHADGSERNVA
jgi:hypothetical protein